MTTIKPQVRIYMYATWRIHITTAWSKLTLSFKQYILYYYHYIYMVTRVVGTFGKSIESHALSNYIDYTEPFNYILLLILSSFSGNAIVRTGTHFLSRPLNNNANSVLFPLHHPQVYHPCRIMLMTVRWGWADIIFLWIFFVYY